MQGYTIPSREEAGRLDDRAEWPYEVVQWAIPNGTEPDGTPKSLPRHVVLRALTVRQMMDAERAAQEKGRDGAWAPNPYRLMVEIVRRGIVSPPDLPAEVIYGWNHAAVLGIFYELQTIGGYRAAVVAQALQGLAGEPAPPVRGAAVPGEPERDRDDLGADPGPPEEDPAGEPAELVA